MEYILKNVDEFQKSFNQTRNSIPTLVPLHDVKLRYHLMEEENGEYLDAVAAKDIVGVADALTDMLYVLAGTIITHGMQDIIVKLFTNVHHSNMSKLDDRKKPIVNGANGVLDNTRPLGKVLKSEYYFEPSLARIVSQGIINSKRKLSNEVFTKIEELRFHYGNTKNLDEKREILMKIEELNKELLNLSVNLADLKIHDGK